MLLTNTITVPGGPAELAQEFVGTVYPAMRADGMSTTVWLDVSASEDLDYPTEFLVQTLAEQVPPRLLESAFGSHGWQPAARLYRALDLSRLSFSLPPSGGTMGLCDMPHNSHSVPSGRLRPCASGQHTLSDDHKIANCPCCGARL